MTRTTMKVSSFATRMARKSAIVAFLCVVMLVVGVIRPSYAYGDTLSNAQAALTAAQKELTAAKNELTAAEKELTAAKTALTAAQNALNATAVTKDVVISGKTPLYMPVSGNTKKPANSTLVGVEGKYVNAASDSTPRTQQQILDYINSVRKDAYNTKLADGTRVASSYKALAFSKNLERTAQIRAAEISIYGDHTRPSGESWYGVSDEGLMPTSAENLSWGANYYNNIKMWVDEKPDYIKYLNCSKGKKTVNGVNQCSYGVYGHYRNLVNPSYNKIGLAQFNSDRSTINPYNTAMAAEFSAAGNSNSSDVKAVNKTVYQGVYVKSAAMGSVGTAGATTFNPTKVSGDPVWSRSAKVNEAKGLAASLGFKTTTTADVTAAQNKVNTAQSKVNTAKTKVTTAQNKVDTAQQQVGIPTLDKLAKDNKNALPDGVYKISMAISSGSVLDVAKASTENANVGIWSDTGDTWQKWKVTHDSQGYITITSLVSGLPLESAGKTPSNGSNVEQWSSHGGRNQKWVAIKDGSSYRLVNAASINGTIYALDAPKSSTAPGTNVHVWTKNTSDGQKWNFTPTELITPGMYRINSQITANNKVALDIPSAATTSGANVHVWAANEGFAQRFYISAPNKNKKDEVTIQAIASGLYVTADSNSNVSQRSGGSLASQLWKVQWQSDGTFTFTNSGTGTRLALASASSANGTNVKVAAANNSAKQQKWRVTSRATLPTGTYTIFSSADPAQGIDIAKGSKSAGANALIWKLSNAQWQKWKLVANSDGTYSFVSANSNNALDVDHGSMKNGANILQWKNSGTTNQRFYVTWDPKLGGFKIAAKANKNYVFDAGSVKNGANLCLWQDNSTKHQRFGFKLAK